MANVYNKTTGMYEIVCDFCGKASGQPDIDPGEAAQKARERAGFKTAGWNIDHKLGDPLPWTCPNCKGLKGK